jgi:hypothetical protein
MVTLSKTSVKYLFGQEEIHSIQLLLKWSMVLQLKATPHDKTTGENQAESGKGTLICYTTLLNSTRGFQKMVGITEVHGPQDTEV